MLNDWKYKQPSLLLSEHMALLQPIWPPLNIAEHIFLTTRYRLFVSGLTFPCTIYIMYSVFIHLIGVTLSTHTQTRINNIHDKQIKMGKNSQVIIWIFTLMFEFIKSWHKQLLLTWTYTSNMKKWYFDKFPISTNPT